MLNGYYLMGGGQSGPTEDQAPFGFFITATGRAYSDFVLPTTKLEIRPRFAEDFI